MIELKEIPIESIIYGDRFREDFGDLNMLIESMKREGIIQPLAVRSNDDGTYNLLAGGRRYMAAVKACLLSIPVRCYPATLSELEMRSIELMENVARKDMGWLESSKLKSEILRLQIAIHGEKRSTAKDAPGVSQRDVADMLGVSNATMVADVRLAEMAAIFPELAKAKDKSEATKMMAKMQENMVREELAKRVENKTATTSIERTHHALINQYIVQDFFAGIKQVPSNSVDFVELDPPYAIRLMEQKRAMEGTHGDAYNEVTEDKYHDFMTGVAMECYRTLGHDAWLCLWHAVEWGSTLYDIFTSAGFQGDIRAAIWYKGNVGQTNTPNLHLASCYEPFFYLRKGNPSIIRQGRSNVFAYKPVTSGNKIHPTERPIEMIQDVIQTFCWEGSRILVPFLGSGNTILAAANLGMTAFGWDLEDEYKNAYTCRVVDNIPGRYHSYKEQANAS
jgi:ParB/RepB/Spo0J family partition protein